MDIKIRNLFLSKILVNLRTDSIPKGEAFPMDLSLHTELKPINPDEPICYFVMDLSINDSRQILEFEIQYTAEIEIVNVPGKSKKAMLNKKESDSLTKEISAIGIKKVFPYVRELVADITRRLPLTGPIQIDPNIGDGWANSSPIDEDESPKKSF